MASFTSTATHIFPAGLEVGLYELRRWGGRTPAGPPPGGPPAATEAMGALSVTFEDVADDFYLVGGEVSSGVWRYVVAKSDTPPASVVSGVTEEELEIERVARIQGDADEATARDAAVGLEADTLEALVVAEAVDRSAAVAAEAAARAGADTALSSEIAARQLTVQKGAAGGYAGLDGAVLVPRAQLGSGSPSGSNYLRGDGAWVTPPAAVATLPGGWFDPLDYGAVGDGVADDTAAVQAAINAAKATLGGGTVYFDSTKKFSCAGHLDVNNTYQGIHFLGSASNNGLGGDPATQYSLRYTGNGDQVVTDGATTNGSAVLTSTQAKWSSGDRGRAVTGAGIPGGTTILTVTNATTVVLSANATATASGVSVTIKQRPFIRAGGSLGLTMGNLRVVTNNSSFTGELVEVSGNPNTDSALFDIYNCAFSGTTSGNGNCTALNLQDTIVGVVRQCSFFYLAHGASLKRTPGYANAIHFYSCHFSRLKAGGWGVTNTHEACTMIDCTFENRQDGSAGAYRDTVGSFGPTAFIGCWFGDTSTYTDPWVYYKGYALTVRECLMNSPGGFQSPGSLNGPGIVLDPGGGTGQIQNINLMGNRFFGPWPAVKVLAGAGVFNLVAIGNYTFAAGNPLLDDSLNPIYGKYFLGNDVEADSFSDRLTLLDGATLKVNAGPINDGHFATAPPSGTVGGVDTTNNRLYVKVGATWKYVALV